MADRRQAKRPCILSEAELEARRVEYVRRRAAGIAYLRNPLAPGALEEVLRPFQQKHKAATVIQSHVRSRIVRNVCGVCLECERSLALGSSCLDDWPRSRCCYCLRFWQFCKTRGAKKIERLAAADSYDIESLMTLKMADLGMHKMDFKTSPSPHETLAQPASSVKKASAGSCGHHDVLWLRILGPSLGCIKI